MIEAILYYHGPDTSWNGRVSEREIVARRPFRFVWAARLWARGVHRHLDPARCGWAVLRDGGVVELVERTP